MLSVENISSSWSCVACRSKHLACLLGGNAAICLASTGHLASGSDTLLYVLVVVLIKKANNPNYRLEYCVYCNVQMNSNTSIIAIE